VPQKEAEAEGLQRLAQEAEGLALEALVPEEARLLAEAVLLTAQVGAVEELLPPVLAEAELLPHQEQQVEVAVVAVHFLSQDQKAAAAVTIQRHQHNRKSHSNPGNTYKTRNTRLRKRNEKRYVARTIRNHENTEHIIITCQCP